LSGSIFGLLLGPQDVEDAVVAAYRAWLNEYITQVEIQRGFPHGTIPRPPSRESIHGGTDLETWVQEELPAFIVVVKAAPGEPERHGNGTVTGAFTVEVGCQWIGSGSERWPEPEDEARAIASYLGTASQLLVQKVDALALPIERLVMTAQPDVTFPDEEKKTIARAITRFELWLLGIVNEQAGPVGVTPRESPYYPGQPESEWPTSPTITSEHLTVAGEPL
jgi:hypothetical protein